MYTVHMLETSQEQIEITHDQVESWYPLIAVPCYDQLLTEPFYMSCIKMAMQFKEINLKFAISTLSDSLISRARNQLVAKFMSNPEFTHLLFIDADIGFNPEDILKMLWYDKEIMTGAYPIKDINWDRVSALAKSGEPTNTLMSKSLRYVVNATKDRSGNVRVDKGALEIYDAGTGFMLIKREVFERLFYAYPELKYRDDTGTLSPAEREFTYALFNSYVDDDGRFLSEDYGFGRYWQKIGGSVWVDPTIELTHIGRMRYTGKMLDYLSLVVSTDEPPEKKTGNKSKKAKKS